ncbi:unnamed protein product, partial [Prorocentrum cordatum]
SWSHPAGPGLHVLDWECKFTKDDLKCAAGPACGSDTIGRWQRPTWCCEDNDYVYGDEDTCGLARLQLAR